MKIGNFKNKFLTSSFIFSFKFCSKKDCSNENLTDVENVPTPSPRWYLSDPWAERFKTDLREFRGGDIWLLQGYLLRRILPSSNLVCHQDAIKLLVEIIT